MRFELIPKTKAKLSAVTVMALKMGQTELKPAVSLRFKVTASNDILNQFDKSLRAFLYEKNGQAAKTQGTLDGVAQISDLPQLTHAASKIGTFGWEDQQTGAKLVIYQGITGDADIYLKDGRVDDFKIDPKEGGTVDVHFDLYAADLDADTLGDLAVLHQHEVEIELTAPEIISQQKTIDDAPQDTPEAALARTSGKGKNGKQTPAEGLAAQLGQTAH